MRRRKLLTALGVVTMAGGIGAALLLTNGGGASAQDDTDTDTPTVSTAVVERTDLVEREDLDGTLGYGEPRQLALGRPGTITALPAEGAVVDRGGSVGEVDGRAVPLLIGTTPLWRVLQAGAEGADVQVLEENLVALGFAPSLNVDRLFTAATATAVKAWQESLGWEETGIVQPTDVVVQPGALRVVEHLGVVGDQAGGPALSVTGTERRITIALAANRQGLVAAGDAVEVVLPDGSRVPGSIASVGTVVSPADDMTGKPASVEVVVNLTDPATAGALSEAPVDVSVVKSQAEGVLAVPVEALLALAEGGYAVERVTGATTELVAIQTGAFAMGLVEVIGEVAEGDEVVVPE